MGGQDLGELGRAFEGGGGGGEWLPEYSLGAMMLSLLLAFVIGQLVAWVYQSTHSGMSYSRSFTQSLVLMTMVVSLVLFVIGDSIVTAFGLIGALAIIRFRNVLKDTRDTVFVFFCLILGMALGSQRYLAAIAGAVTLLLVTLYLHFTHFGSRGTFDGHLSCRLHGEANQGKDYLERVLQLFCRYRKQVSVRHAPGITEYVFQVRLRDRRRSHELIDLLEHKAGIGEVALVLRDELAEV
jgi:Domain of unknown function (DUF4956)